MQPKELLERLYDPHYDITKKNYRTVIVVEKLYREFPNDPIVLEIVQQLLLRLRVDSPFVYAVTIGQFPTFKGIHEYWKEYGYVDGQGFTWVAPKLYGPYMSNR